ncbi:MAG TPA: cupin domain-containing protein [Acetobacteraceae bacterium]|nr:cupin domain-containing protein [Acetobacteraceae bacterium]
MTDLFSPGLAAKTVIASLGLAPHPEGGHYRETWRDRPADGRRGAASAIFFLLAAGEESAWHKVDAAELWLWHAGAPLRLEIAPPRAALHLGADPSAGQTLQGIVPAEAWQSARSLGAWTLVSCIVAPAFDFAGFTLAPPGWMPPG